MTMKRMTDFRFIVTALVLAAMLAACQSGPRDSFDKARLAWARGEHEAALRMLNALAKRDDREALALLGAIYASGEAVGRDLKRGLALQVRAAEAGHLKAQYNVGVMYARGMGAPRSLPMARSWFLSAAEAGLPQAQLHLGLMREKGWGVSPCPYGASKWYYRAGIRFLELGNVKMARHALASIRRLLPDYYLAKELADRIYLHSR